MTYHQRFKTPEERFWEKVHKTETCWLWTGATLRGYGRFNAGQRQFVQAHRFVYELCVGVIPEGLQIDHLCRVKNCVNPKHLEVVTQRVNLRRAPNQVTTANSHKVYCKRGHPLWGDNIYPSQLPRRICVACRKWRYDNRQSAVGDRLLVDPPTEEE